MVLTAHACELCGGREADVIGTRDRHGHALRTVLCRGCGLGWVDPRPDQARLRDFYARDYRLVYKGSRRPGRRHLVRETRRAIQRAGDKALGALPGGAKLLDVGAGAGFFSYVAAVAGLTVTGIEPNHDYAAFARREFGVDVRTCFVEDAAFDPGSFDAITLHHVLEHLDAPLAALQRLHGWLCSGGLLLLEVPNLEAGHRSPRHRFHRGHLYWFNPQTALALAHKAGFACLHQRLAPDTRHIQLTLQRQPDAGSGGVPGSGRDWRNPANSRHVLGTLAGHTQLGHYTTVQTYRRWLRRLAGYLGEARHGIAPGTPREVVDRVLRASLQGSADSR